MQRGLRIACLMLGILSCGGVESPPSGPRTLLYFEGSFDAATKTFEITHKDPVTGKRVNEATVPYGMAAGQAYLHTSGIGDGRASDREPPSFGVVGINMVGAGIWFENGTGSTITAPKVVWDTIPPATVTIRTQNGQVGTTCSPFSAAPCTMVFLGTTTIAGFPLTGVAQTTMGQPLQVIDFDTSAIGGGNFTFTGHLTD